MDNETLANELYEIKEQIDELASQARALVREHAPDQMAWADAYGVFNMTGSWNRYDQTFEKLIENLQGEEY